MRVWMVVLWWYVGVGSLNAAAAGGRGRLILNHERSPEGLMELAFYVLLWPLQALFWTLVGIHNLIGWMLSRLMGER